MSIDAGVTQERGSLLAHERLCHQHFYDLNKKCTKTDGRGGKMMATMANRLYGNGVGAYDYGGKYNRKNTPSNRRRGVTSQKGGDKIPSNRALLEKVSQLSKIT